MTRLSNKQSRELLNNKSSKPIKHPQGSNAGKAPPLQQVRTTGLKTGENGYSEVKQDMLQQSEVLYKRFGEELNNLSETEALPIWALRRKLKFFEEILRDFIKI